MSIEAFQFMEKELWESDLDKIFFNAIKTSNLPFIKYLRNGVRQFGIYYYYQAFSSPTIHDDIRHYILSIPEWTSSDWNNMVSNALPHPTIINKLLQYRYLDEDNYITSTPTTKLCVLDRNTKSSIAMIGNVELCHQLSLDPQEFTDDMLLGAINNNRFDMVKYLVQHNCPWPTMQIAAQRNYYSILKFIHEQGYPCDGTCHTYYHSSRIPFCPKVRFGKSKVEYSDDTADKLKLKGMIEYGKHSPLLVECLDGESSLKDYPEMKYLPLLTRFCTHFETEDFSDHRATLMELDQKFHIPLVNAYFEDTYEAFVELVENNCTIIPSKFKNLGMMIQAVRRGDLRVLQFLHENGYPQYGLAGTEAARRGHLQCLQYLCEQGYVCNGSTISSLVRTQMKNGAKGRVACLEYLLKKGIVPPPRALICASIDGSLEFVKLLVTYNCPIRDKVWLCIIHGGHLDCLRFLYEHVPERGIVRDRFREATTPSTRRLCGLAARCGQVACLEYLLSQLQGNPHPQLTITAAYGGHVHVLQLLRQRNMEWYGTEWSCCMQRDKHECLQYLIEHGCPHPSVDEMMSHAVFQKATRCIHYLSTINS